MTADHLCYINDIEESSAKGLQLKNGQAVFIVKKDGELFAYENSCPHLGVELNWVEDEFLDPDQALIQCATHGALFLIESGECVFGPCQGKFLKTMPITIDSEGKVFKQA